MYGYLCEKKKTTKSAFRSHRPVAPSRVQIRYIFVFRNVVRDLLERCGIFSGFFNFVYQSMNCLSSSRTEIIFPRGG